MIWLISSHLFTSHYFCLALSLCLLNYGVHFSFPTPIKTKSVPLGSQSSPCQWSEPFHLPQIYVCIAKQVMSAWIVTFIKSQSMTIFGAPELTIILNFKLFLSNSSIIHHSQTLIIKMMLTKLFRASSTAHNLSIRSMATVSKFPKHKELFAEDYYEQD